MWICVLPVPQMENTSVSEFTRPSNSLYSDESSFVDLTSSTVLLKPAPVTCVDVTVSAGVSSIKMLAAERRPAARASLGQSSS